MITISEDKISANQSLKPNGVSEILTNITKSITLEAGESTTNTFVSYTLKSEFVYEAKFNVTIKKWENKDNIEPTEFSTKTFKWADLQGGVILYEEGKSILRAYCNVSNKKLTITYSVTNQEGASMSNTTFSFTAGATVNEAIMVEDLEFKNGFLKISPIIDYQEKIYLTHSKQYTLPNSCIVFLRRRYANTSGWSDWGTSISLYKKGTICSTGSNDELEIYIYLTFKNPED